MEVSWREKKCGVWARTVLLGLLVSSMLGPRAYAQFEINPDHFDSPEASPMPKAKAAGSAKYDRDFSLPYSVMCKGMKLSAGKYSISLRSDGKVGQATLNQKGHAIEIAGVVRKETSRQRDEVVVVENNQNVRTLSVVRVSGLDFVFDPKRRAHPTADRGPTRAQNLPLTMIASK